MLQIEATTSGFHMMLGIKPGLLACQARLPTELHPRPHYGFSVQTRLALTVGPQALASEVLELKAHTTTTGL